MNVTIVLGDITKEAATVDAIVNAANVRLLGGGGVDGAIHRKAGTELKNWIELNVPELRPGIRCPTGEAFLSPGFGVPCDHIIHTVGPIFPSIRSRGLAYPGEALEASEPQEHPLKMLAKAIKNCLGLARSYGFCQVAMPAISCGVFGCEIEDFAAVLAKVANSRNWGLDELRIVLYSEPDFDRFTAAWKETING